MKTPHLYEFQFKQKSVPYYVDVEAHTIKEAINKANTIDHDFTLVPKYDGAEHQIKRVVLFWDGSERSYTRKDIIFVFNLTTKTEIANINKLK